jgi:hypothetical protein
MIGWSVAIRRKDGSLLMSIHGDGFATKVWFTRGLAVKHANELRSHKLDAVVVKVDYQDPTIIGPARYVSAGKGGV